jgi:hypothetical protein
LRLIHTRLLQRKRNYIMYYFKGVDELFCGKQVMYINMRKRAVKKTSPLKVYARGKNSVGQRINSMKNKKASVLSINPAL